MGSSKAGRKLTAEPPESAESVARAEKLLTAHAFKTVGEVRGVLHNFALANRMFKTFYYGSKSPTEAEALEWIIGRLGEGNDDPSAR